MGNRVLSIDVLARRPKRDWKKPHFDATHLIERGLIARRRDQQVEVMCWASSLTRTGWPREHLRLNLQRRGAGLEQRLRYLLPRCIDPPPEEAPRENPTAA